MKNLTKKELDEAPNRVQYIYTMSLMNQPIGRSTFDETVNKYPEYFSDEVEYRRKWVTIPQEVHDAYWKEYWDIHNEIFKDLSFLGKGILYYADHPEESNDYYKIYNKVSPIFDKKEKKLHKKYYSKYGIKRLYE